MGEWVRTAGRVKAAVTVVEAVGVRGRARATGASVELDRSGVNSDGAEDDSEEGRCLHCQDR